MVRRGEKSHLYSPKNRLKTVKYLKQSILKQETICAATEKY